MSLVIGINGTDVFPRSLGWSSVSLGIVMGVIAFIAGSHQNKIFSEMDYSFATPFYSVMPIVETALALIFLREGITLYGILGISIITVGAVVISTSGQRLQLQSLRLVLPIIINLIMFSLLSVIQKHLVLETNPFTTIWMMYLGVIALGLPMIIRMRSKITIIILMRKHLFAYTISAILALLCGVSAFSYLPVGVVSALKNLTMPIVVLVGSLFLGEGDLRSRVVGSGVIASGAIVMGLR